MARSNFVKLANNFVLKQRNKARNSKHAFSTVPSGNVDNMQFSKDILSKNETERRLSSLGLAYPYGNTSNLGDDQIQTESELAKEISSNFNSPALCKLLVDTHALVKLLQSKGFSEEQSEVVIDIVLKIVSSHIGLLESQTVTKASSEITVQKIVSQLSVLKRDMLILEKADFSRLQTENEKLAYELLQLRKTVQDEVKDVRNDLTLDLNLEKSKVKDIHIGHEKLIEEKNNGILQKLVDIEKDMQQLEKKTNKDTAELETMFERYKSDTIKLSFGAVATCMTIVLGFYRLWM